MSGPSREEREAQARLRRQEDEDRTLRNTLITTATQPDPLAERLRSEDLAFLDYESGKDGPVDITKAPGLGANLDLFNRAKNKQMNERAGVGILRMGTENQNPELAARIAEQHQTEREQDAAGALENAYNVRRAEVHGSALPLINQREGHNMGLASLASGNSNAATQAYLQFLTRPRRPSIWGQIAGGAIGALSHA